MSLPVARAPESVRYHVLVKIASGGMATVYLGCTREDPRQLVAIKRPHPHLVEDASFRRDLFAEATLAARIRHDNVVSVRDVQDGEGSLDLVMDYVEGHSLAELIDIEGIDRQEIVRIGLRALLDACAGLHAAHELRGGRGEPLGVVHRDVSPQNILVGLDGVSRVVDFGVAKCVHQRDRASTTAGTLKGKLAYMAPEYLGGQTIDRRSDVFAIGVMLWELLTGLRLFKASSEAETLARILTHHPPPISSVLGMQDRRFDATVSRALAKDRAGRYPTMLDLARAITDAARGTSLVASPAEVAAFMERVAGARLAARRADVARLVERMRGNAGGPESSTVQFVAPARPPLGESDPRTPDLPPAPPHSSSISAVEPTRRVPKGAVLATAAGGLLASALAIAFIAHRTHARELPASSAIAVSPSASALPAPAVPPAPSAAPGVEQLGVPSAGFSEGPPPAPVRAGARTAAASSPRLRASAAPKPSSQDAPPASDSAKLPSNPYH